jgi:type III secretion protein X
MSDVKLGRGNPFAFDRGIDDVTYKRKDQSNAQFVMPDQQMLLPVEERQRPKLDALLAQPSLDALIEAALQPYIADPELLQPARFRDAMRRTLASLRRSAASKRDSQPAEVKVLNRGIRILVEEEELQELVLMYRSSLYQG